MPIRRGPVAPRPPSARAGDLRLGRSFGGPLRGGRWRRAAGVPRSLVPRASPAGPVVLIGRARIPVLAARERPGRPSSAVLVERRPGAPTPRISASTAATGRPGSVVSSPPGPGREREPVPARLALTDQLPLLVRAEPQRSAAPSARAATGSRALFERTRLPARGSLLGSPRLAARAVDRLRFAVGADPDHRAAPTGVEREGSAAFLALRGVLGDDHRRPDRGGGPVLRGSRKVFGEGRSLYVGELMSAGRAGARPKHHRALRELHLGPTRRTRTRHRFRSKTFHADGLAGLPRPRHRVR